MAQNIELSAHFPWALIVTVTGSLTAVNAGAQIILSELSEAETPEIPCRRAILASQKVFQAPVHERRATTGRLGRRESLDARR
jgi:hypothetical protein